MTTEELKRAFDICLDTHGCTDCPLLALEQQNGCGCKHNLFVSAIDLATEKEREIAQLKDENIRLRGKLAQVLLSINTVKEMNAMCDIDDQRKQAVKEFAGKVKEEVYPFLQAEMYNKKHFITGDHLSDKLLENQNIGILKAQDVLSKWFKVKIDELLKEAEGINNDH